MGINGANIAKDFHPDKYYCRHSWIQLTRPMTLTGTISPILVGTGLALKDGQIQIDLFVALLIAALLIQSATNILNDYFDFKYGQDKEKWIHKKESIETHGPSHHLLPYIAGAMFAVSIGIGLWLAFSSTLWVILAGVLGILAGIKYSAGSQSFSSIGMGELVAAIFLGPVVTMLAYLVQTNLIDFQIIFVSLLFAMLIASMILTNNIRDLKKDIGFRKTSANILGRKHAINLLMVLLGLPYVTVLLLIIFRVLPLATLSSIFALPFAIRLIWSFRKNATRADEISGMKWAAIHHWTFGLLLATSLFLT